VVAGGARNFCDVIGGSFTAEVFGDGTHHFYYSNGEFRSAD
jgi:hypothetical protein